MRWKSRSYNISKPPYSCFALIPHYCKDTKEYVWLEKIYYVLRVSLYDVYAVYFSSEIEAEIYRQKHNL